MKRLFVLTIALMVAMTTFAKTQDIGGKVVDAQGNPLPYVNVVLLSMPDSAFVQGAVTDEQGIYKITTTQNEGLLKFSSVGYVTHYEKAADGLTVLLEEDAQMNLADIQETGYFSDLQIYIKDNNRAYRIDERG